VRKREGWEIGAEVLAAISTEVKIPAHEAIRKSSNIISLLGISWNTRETDIHFLPEIFFEGAQHGNVHQYLQSTPKMNSSSKALMLTDIASGLAVLHANGMSIVLY
jgi:serine/threonine protein kinase